MFASGLLERMEIWKNDSEEELAGFVSPYPEGEMCLNVYNIPICSHSQRKQ